MTVRLVVLFVVLAVTAPVAVVAQDPATREALVGLARVERDAGDVQAARHYFDRARALEPFDLPTEREYFWVLAAASPAEALAVAGPLLALDPDGDDVRERAIGIAADLGDEVAVQRLARAGVERGPERARWHRPLAESLVRQGDVAGAVPIWERAVAAPDAVASDRAGLAMALEATGAHRRALDAWDALPESERRQRTDWARSHLRSMAVAAPAAVAAEAVEAWLTDHDDRDLQRVLVDLWHRAGSLDRARAAIVPLLDGPDRHNWLRRDAALAVAAGRPADAIVALEQLVDRRVATRGDRLTLAGLLIDAGQVSSAVAAIESIAPAPSCDPDALALVDRIAGAAGTDRLLEWLDRPSCRAHADWAARGIERAVAEGRHAAALALVEALPADERAVPGLRRTEGQLRLWTGDAPAAIRLLEPHVEEFADDLAAREALVDALRAVGDPYAAWRVGRPLLEASDTTPARLVSMAELALEADQPRNVDAILARLRQGAIEARLRTALDGRALTALSRPAEAMRVLASVPLTDLHPAAALALVDSLHATRGPVEALAVAEQTSATAAQAPDLVARRLMLESLVTGTVADPSVRDALAAADPWLPTLVDAEVALARERPHDALTVLDTVPADIHPWRVRDLRVTALAGTGDWQAASELLAALRLHRPDFVPFALREAELTWREQPGPETLAAVLVLPDIHPDRLDARIVAARALDQQRRHEDVADLLGDRIPLGDLSIEGRVLLARSLSMMGDPRRALGALEDVDLRGDGLQLFAELVWEVRGPAAGARAFRLAAAAPDASADVLAAWATATTDPVGRVAILKDGIARFDDSALLWSRLASAHAATGDGPGSLEAARRAVALDATAGDAWYQLLANTMVLEPGRLEELLDRFAAVAATHPPLAIAVADQVAALVRSASDPVFEAALAWLRVDPVDLSLRLPRDLALVRLHAAAERWTDALVAADRAVESHADPSAERVRADVLSWAGRHDEALAAYDAYLERIPNDIDARRQQARVAGWAGHFDRARAIYADLIAVRPDDRAIAAEAAAKSAFFDGRWREAVRLYGQWLAVEPGNGEARFELAEALRASGETERADATLAALSPDGGHRLAEAARAREAWRREPSVAVVAEHVSADGYGGQRLLDLGTTGGRLHSVFGAAGRQSLTAEAASVHVAASGSARSGHRASVGGRQRIGRAWALDGRIGAWDVSGPGAMAVEGEAATSWAPADRWTLEAGVGRELIVDTIDTIDQRTMATGGFAGVALEAPHTSLTLIASRQHISDGNRRSRVSASFTRALSQRLDHVRAIGWAEWLDYDRRSATYFAPQGFVRVDAGLEYTHVYSEPRFLGDRMNQLGFGYLVGTDSDGALYHHPSIRLDWELSSSVAVGVRGDLVRSRSYRERSLMVSLHLLGGAFRGER